MATDLPRPDGVYDDFGIDYTRPVFGQLDQLGDRYWAWSHVHLTPAFRRRLAEARPDAPYPDSFPIFAGKWLESQTHIRWQHVLALWGTVVVLCFAGGVTRPGMTLATALGWFAGGFLLWTLVEYILHRVIFHKIPDTPLGVKFHFLAHGIHHKDPWDKTRLVFPILGAIGLASIIFGVVSLVAPLGPSLLIMSGLLVGYLAYDLGHFAWHHAKYKAGWFQYLKRYHLAHHYQDMDSRFGVSQPFWDWVFRSGNLRV
jgi:sterol desaturase/sphingolipid hydroxylase (fatty acid hydroxylase superfamily)